MEPWWHTVVAPVAERREQVAVEVTRKAADRGSLGARVRLARFGEVAGISQDEADAIVDQASSEARDEDQTAHWVLSGAYDLLLGQCDYEEKSRRMLVHLEKHARASADPGAALAVAVNWAMGRVGVEPDPCVAVDWFYIAHALGHPDATEHLNRYTRWLSRREKSARSARRGAA